MPAARRYNEVMARPVKITTPFPTLMETAKVLGVSKRDALRLSEMARRSAKAAFSEMPGPGRRLTFKGMAGPKRRRAQTSRRKPSR
jgi:hypothetical protein